MPIDPAALAGLCSRLVQFDTVNPPGNEAPLAEHVAGLLRSAGLTVELLPLAPGRASLIARLRGAGTRPALLFSGHLDTLTIGDAVWQHPPFAGQIAAGKVWGRGASDMKAGDAAMIAVAQHLAAAQTPLQGDLILALSADEEKTQLGACDIAKHLRGEPIQGILIPEPTENQVLVAHKGALWLEVTTHGKAGHISRQSEARNAIPMMLPILSQFLVERFDFAPHPLLGEMQRSINMLSAGQKMNTIPDRCAATLEIRTVPGQDHAAIVAQVERMIADVGRRAGLPDFRATVEIVHRFPSVDTPPAHPFVQMLCGAVERVTGSRPAPAGVTYGSDACVFAPELGAPFAVCGPGSFNATAATDEWVDIANIVATAEIYLDMAVKLLT